MGCIQAKPSSPARRWALDKLQADHGYEPGRLRQRNNALAVKPDTQIVKTTAVHGWPKWLLDNISHDILAGFVPRSADSYDKLAKIGHGTYSNVYKARDRETKKIVALKKVRFDTTEPESVKFMAREIMILRKLDHPNIVKLRGLATSRMHYSLYLVFDFMRSDLNKLLSRSDLKLSEAQVKCYMQQLLSGLQHCHDRGVLHRDIKSSNLLLDKTGTLKIADFGLATFVQPEQKRPLTSRVVTLWYRAPELLLGSTDYGVGIDLWSSGCLFAEMFIGRPFMAGRTEVEQLHKIFKLCGAPLDEFWRRMKLPTSFRPPQHYKPSFEEAFKEFPNSSFGLLLQLLALDPASRGSAASALQTDFFSTSPLACDLSALPVINADENEPTQAKDKKKNKKPRSSNSKKPCQTDHDSNPRKEEKNFEPNMKSQKTGNSASASASASASTSTRSSNKETENEDHVFDMSLGVFSRTEAHPNAMKNIKNFTLLQASVTDIINHNEGSALAHYFRSLSALDFRNRDDKMFEPFSLDKE